METESPKRYQHHTPRFYLLPWADVDERIWWLGYGKIRRSGLTVVGGENDFYKLKELTNEDIAFLRNVIKQLPEAGQRSHEEFLAAYSLPTTLKRNVTRTRNVDSKVLVDLDVAIANTNENYHTAIENSFWPHLMAMREGDTSFYEDDEKAIEFFHALSVQYLRTKRVKDRIIERVRISFENIERVWDVLSHMLALSMGGSLFVDRKKFKVVLIDNTTDVPFITADQPIINLKSNPDDLIGPSKVGLYYPLSPTKAMLFLEKSNPIHAAIHSISIDEAHAYNVLVADHFGRQIFSNSKEYLNVIKRHLEN